MLTTGQALADDSSTATAYLRGLAAAGAVGVVVELGVHVDDGAARRWRAPATDSTLPVIALHRQIRFVEVTEEVHRLIVAEQYDGGRLRPPRARGRSPT